MSEQPATPSALPAGLAEPAFDPNAMRVLKERYFAKKADGTAETPKEFLWRVASSIAKPERPYAAKLGKDADAVVDGVSHAFYDMMSRRDFLPNTPCLVNAGRPLSMLSACFVLPVPDSIDGIFYNLKAMALIQKSGGGTGFSFSDLRHQGAEVFSTGKDASGPVSFMKVFNAATDSIKQGGVRRGANMGVLRVDHPDVYHFMSCKKELDAENRALWNRMSDTGRYTDAQLAHMKQELLQTQINNFNISVGVTDAFMAAVKSDGDFDLRDPRTKDVVRTVKAREIWDALVEGAWQNGEPGVLFLDHPDVNPLPGLGPIEATNPCVTADTWITTSDGARRVSQLLGTQFTAMVDGKAYPSGPDGFFFTGVKQAYDVRTNRGFSVKATGDHKVLCVDEAGRRNWKTVSELTIGDKVVLHNHEQFSWQGEGTFDEGSLLGSLIGDGHFRAHGHAKLEFWGVNAPAHVARAADRLSRTVKVRSDARGTLVAERKLASVGSVGLAKLAHKFGIVLDAKHVSSSVEGASSDFVRGFLQAWFDADGSVRGTFAKGVSVRLTSNHRSDLEAAQRMLARFGIVSTLYAERKAACDKERPDGKGGHKTYPCEAVHELVVSRESFDTFVERIGFSDEENVDRMEALANSRTRSAYADRWYSEVVAVESVGEVPVFDCQVAEIHAFDANGLYVHNCGEQFLHGYDSCNLGSINVGNFFDTRSNEVDWERLAQSTSLALRFLDNVIDANLYPIDEIEEMVTNNRRVGLGIMGFAELLIKLEIAYGSAEAIAFAGKLMAFIQARAEETSETLARERGDFPNKHLSIWANDPRPRRNAALLSIAPTGTISMIAGCAFGCEPYFGMAYTKHVMKDAEGRPQHLYYVVPLFEEIAKREGFFSDELLGKVEENRGSLKGISEVPKHWQDVFTTSADVTVDQHIDMLAAFQKNTCNAVSKTINAPNDDTRENVSRAIFRAYDAGCKGFTYYRDGSRTEQVVTFSKDNDLAGGNRDVATAPALAAPVAASTTAAMGTVVEPDIAALLAKANALLEVR
jgi:ribonucleoside-diphosphate reductase alpha chain